MAKASPQEQAAALAAAHGIPVPPDPSMQLFNPAEAKMTVPNNSASIRHELQGLQQQMGLCYGNPYGDWEEIGAKLGGMGVNFRLAPPQPVTVPMVQGPPEISNGFADYAVQGLGLGNNRLVGPLEQEPNDLVKDQGLAARVPRQPRTGSPIGLPMPMNNIGMELQELGLPSTRWQNPMGPEPLPFPAAPTEMPPKGKGRGRKG